MQCWAAAGADTSRLSANGPQVAAISPASPTRPDNTAASHPVIEPTASSASQPVHHSSTRYIAHPIDWYLQTQHTAAPNYVLSARKDSAPSGSITHAIVGSPREEGTASGSGGVRAGGLAQQGCARTTRRAERPGSCTCRPAPR